MLFYNWVMHRLMADGGLIMLEDEILNEMDNEKKEEVSENTIENTVSNEIVELDKTTETMYDMQKVEVTDGKEPKKKKNKNKKPSFMSKLSKKQKIIIGCVAAAIVLIVAIVLLWIFVFNDDEKEPVIKDPEVIVEKENYRYEDGTLVFLDDDDKEIGEYTCENKDEEKCFVPNYNKDDDDFDVTTKIYADYTKVTSVVKIMANKFVFVYDNSDPDEGEIKLWDIDAKESLGSFKFVKQIDDDKVIVKNTEDKYGVYAYNAESEELEVLLEFTYDYIGYIENTEKLVVKSGEEATLVNFAGEVLSKAVVGDIKNFDDKYISVVNDGYALYDYKGNVVLDEEIDYIDFNGGYVFTISSKKLFAYDDELNPLNMKGIKVDNSNYKVTIKFDDKGVETERKQAYAISISGGNINVALEDEEIAINTYEGKLSAEFKYISYFDGILYFYKDEAKTEELGRYECQNPNNITKETKSFDNCFIAKESALLNRGLNADNIGYLPIFNSRYVFIVDNKNVVSEDTIYLWDLKNSDGKVEATYAAVDAGYYNNAEVVNMVSSAGTYVMAKNKSNSFGIIKIETGTLSSITGFKDNAGNSFKAIKYLGDNFLVQTDKNSYALFSPSGEVLAEANNEIVEYRKEAIKVLNNAKYDVYSLGGKIIGTNYDYVAFYDEYYVAVAENKINVYKYEESAKGIIEEGVELTGDVDYASCYTFANGVLSVNGMDYSYLVDGGEE